MSIGGGGSSANSQTQLDPQIKGDWQHLYDLANQKASSGVPQEQIAGQNGFQQAGLSQAGAAANAGQSAVAQAQQEAVAGANPQINAIYGEDIGPSSASAGLIDPSRVGQVSATGLPQTDLSGYLNPYKQDVYNTSLTDLNLARQRANNQDSSDATVQGGEGAAGGSRAGVADSLNNEAYYRQAASLAANLNQQGYDTATQLAETDAARQLQAQTQNQTTNEQTQATNAGLLTNTGQFNAGQANAVNTDNANRQLTAAAADQQAQEQRAGYQLQGAGVLGQLGQTQQQLALNGANELFGLGSQTQQQQQGQFQTQYQNQLSQENLPLQQLESAFGIIPSTGSGAVTHSNGKSGQVGIGG